MCIPISVALIGRWKSKLLLFFLLNSSYRFTYWSSSSITFLGIIWRQYHANILSLWRSLSIYYFICCLQQSSWGWSPGLVFSHCSCSCSCRIYARSYILQDFGNNLDMDYPLHSSKIKSLLLFAISDENYQISPETWLKWFGLSLSWPFLQ